MLRRQKENNVSMLMNEVVNSDIQKSYIVYEVIPYKNTLNQIEYDLCYDFEFYTIKDIANHYNLSQSLLSKKVKASRKVDYKKPIMFKKHYAEMLHNTYYQVIYAPYSEGDLL